jgi:putative hydrolase of the HAD superfamily
MLDETLESFNKISLNYQLKTYEDYCFINLHSKTKFLVTSGHSYFQNLKIENMGIAKDFIEIFVHDDSESSYTGKLTIFKNILDKYELSSNQVLVVGDNPASEIAAGKALNMKTVQILRDGVIKTDGADFYIDSFSELKDL